MKVPRSVLWMCLLSLVAVACRQYLPENRFLRLRASPRPQSTADARGKFDHERHAPAFAQREITCLHCHRFDVRMGTSDADVARQVSTVALYPPAGVSCHHCHTETATKMSAAPQACTTCHENLTPLRPANHDVAWLKVHATLAKTDPTSCDSCHRQAECIDCHQRRDTIQTRVHERNFRFFHSVEVRANPMKCGSCHREDFCIRCHEKALVEGPER